jgi:hypothetical protein
VYTTSIVGTSTPSGQTAGPAPGSVQGLSCVLTLAGRTCRGPSGRRGSDSLAGSARQSGTTSHPPSGPDQRTDWRAPFSSDVVLRSGIKDSLETDRSTGQTLL